ncbi:MAG: hypothetical protein V7L05_22330 [Nostoc sp.]
MSDRSRIFFFFTGSGFLYLGFKTIMLMKFFLIHGIAAYRYLRQVINLVLPEYAYDDGGISQIEKEFLSLFPKQFSQGYTNNSW